MQSRRRRRSVFLAVACLTGLLAVGQALGADATVRATDSSDSYAPGTNQPSIPAAGSLDFKNNSTFVSHSVTADGNGPDGKRLFRTPVFSGDTRAVVGVQYLSPGTYKFHCSVHPVTMKGTLTVRAGTPVARPAIAVAIRSRRIDRVRRSGRLKVKVHAKTKSSDVSLVAKKGHKRLASDKNIDLRAGQSKTIRMQLSKRARKSLKGLNKARVKLQGKVPFGAPDTATRTLR
jgi:plastocyanin